MTPNDKYCRHYTGAFARLRCQAGIEYKTVEFHDGKEQGEFIDLVHPCYCPAIRGRCAKFEGFTSEEIAQFQQHNRMEG